MIESELHVVGGKHSGQVIPVNPRRFLIGRESDCHLRPNSELVSRHHCVFSVDEYSVRLKDLGSTNGTTVNGERIRKEVTLVAGDRVVVGNLEFEFRLLSPSQDAGDETVVSETETVMEISSPASNEAAAETQSIPEPEQPTAGSATQQLPVMGSPLSGDTTVINQPVMMPGQQPYQPMMPPPMGYPGQAYGGYPYQPGVPQPQMYPQGFPPQPVMPGQVLGFPQPQPPAPAPAPAPEPAVGNAPEVSLPDPSETGAVEPQPKKAEDDAKGSSDDGDSTNPAADIIRQYTQRRPGG